MKQRLWYIKFIPSAVITLLFLLGFCSTKVYAKQRSYSVAFSALEGGEGNTNTATMVAADGDEYTFTVTNVPGGISIAWSVDEQAGIWTVNGNTVTFQSPILDGQKTYHIKAKAVGGEGGDTTYEYTWTTVSKEPFLDVYLKDGGVESKNDTYVAVPNNTETIYAFVSTASGGSGESNILINFTNERTGTGGEGSLSVSSGRTGTNPAGELSTMLTTSTTAGDYHIVTADVKGPNATGSATDLKDSPKITVFGVEITSADVTQDKIHVNLNPTGLSGTLKLELTGGSSHTIREETRTSGSYDETFDITNLTIGEYTKVKATWTVNEKSAFYEYDYHIKVLGTYTNTRYNTPKEADCTGNATNFCYTTGSCTVTSCNWSSNGSGKSGWLSEVEENGSGYSSSIGWVSLEHWCQNNGYPAPEGCETLLRDLSASGCPACSGESLTANSTVAIKSSNPNLSCGDSVFVYQVGTRTVTDYGGGLTNTQLDHYVGVSGCNAPSSIGDRMTIKLFD